MTDEAWAPIFDAPGTTGRAIRTPKTAELVARKLRRMIVDGELKDGDHLPHEAELMEHFQWFTPEEIQQRLGDSEEHGAVAEELADILIYCISFANSTGIDLSSAIQAKLARNESRFPIQSPLGLRSY